ncbi:hypothetical protein G7046_g3468 [Stylonectria norvegica]|nr:hypothetical protein G7046_g3468 [Stylonectria norvegica]
MGSTLERLAASLDADVLGFDDEGFGGVGLSALFLLLCDPQLSCLLARAAAFATAMTSAVLDSLTGFEAPGALDLALMAHCLGSSPATAASDVNTCLLAPAAVTSVAGGFAKMATRERLLASLRAVGNVVLTRLAWVVHKLVEWRLPTLAVQHHVRSEGAMGLRLVLDMAQLLALV